VISRRQSPYRRFVAILAVAAILAAACGKVSSNDSPAGEHPRGDAGPEGSTGGVPGAGGSAGSSAGPAGSGPVGGSPTGTGAAPASSPDGAAPACEDLTRTLPSPCVPSLCDCAALAGCDVRCWIDVACIRLRCAGKDDPHCADSCGDPGHAG